LFEALLQADPFLQVLTGDALFAGRPPCGQIIAHGRHSLFQIKGDRPQLLAKMRRVFSPRPSRPPAPSRATEEKRNE
jgi:hypothetical protein